MSHSNLFGERQDASAAAARERGRRWGSSSPFPSGQEVHRFLEYTMAGVEQEILGSLSLRKATGRERRIGRGSTTLRLSELLFL